VIIANESSVKVYILSDADKRLKPEAQNAFLKTLEEPVQNTLFLLTAENFKALLPTVLSRATVFATGGDYKNSGGEYAEAAQAIAAAIIKTEEYPLLQGFSRFNKRDEFAEVVAELLAIFRDALAVTSGAKALQSGNTAVLLAQKLRKADILELIDTTNILNDRLYKNVNINLLATWACAEFRRIVWQR
jgi:DNA polymerase III gamma/tau subunit